ncbi:MAG: hypothetical protein LQ340_001402 [Diploschistes diacapsis]|nr:MAG: hypothetical protein LQ340_001402 [Diploschistes diacapsis]
MAAFAWRTAFLTFETLKHRDQEKQSWNSLFVDLYRLSTAHSQYLVVEKFHAALRKPSISVELDQGTIAPVHKLFQLYALHTLEPGQQSRQVRWEVYKDLFYRASELNPLAELTVDPYEPGGSSQAGGEKQGLEASGSINYKRLYILHNPIAHKLRYIPEEPG